MKRQGILFSGRLVILSLLAFLLSSCYSYKSMTRKEPVTRDFLLKLQPGKDYRFELKTGLRFKVHIDTIESETIRGYMYQKDAEGKTNKIAFSSTIEDVEKYVAKISVRESDPIKITTLIALLALSMFIILNPPLLAN